MDACAIGNMLKITPEHHVVVIIRQKKCIAPAAEVWSEDYYLLFCLFSRVQIKIFISSHLSTDRHSLLPSRCLLFHRIALFRRGKFNGKIFCPWIYGLPNYYRWFSCSFPAKRAHAHSHTARTLIPPVSGIRSDFNFCGELDVCQQQ